MKITDVKFEQPDKEKYPGANDIFRVTFEDGTESLVPAEATDNRHYREVKEWYEAQKKPPFKFKFKKLV